ncbi:hypothetical protein EYF80_066362 [Liparis tanakae]|uniref:Uncharacterized protein n=1 Tax=Liparis tanakae TaxID=230148 RepID=A0A4Z2E469_9TELE|nr:hypothetical protein EYF80_066362 [Liparis tanakae]
MQQKRRGRLEGLLTMMTSTPTPR